MKNVDFCKIPKIFNCPVAFFRSAGQTYQAFPKLTVQFDRDAYSSREAELVSPVLF